MIKEKSVLINVSNRTVQKYQKNGYDCVVGSKIEIKISDLHKQSHQKITAICDVCGQMRKLSYYAYMKNWNKYKYYSCEYCKQKKIEETNQEKYGVRRPIQNKEIHKKLEETNKRKYGYKVAVKSNKIKKRESEGLKIDNKLLSTYRTLDILNIEDNIYEIRCKKRHIYKIQNNELNKRIRYGLELCLECNPKEKEKELKREIYEYIRKYHKGEIRREGDRIYVKDIIIEIVELINGSEIYKRKEYYKIESNKTEKYIIIYLDDWKNRKEVIKSKIRRIIGIKEEIIYSDELRIREVLNGKRFIEENSLIRYDGGYELGLYKNDTLYSLLYLKRRGRTYILKGYIEKIGIRVIGGGKKLINTIKDIDYIYGYSSDFIEEDIYLLLGFRREKRLPIRYKYILNGNRVERQEVLQLDLGFGKIEGKDEHRICLDNGIFRIYDIGRYRWVKTIRNH